jgi:hypothetical protein
MTLRSWLARRLTPRKRNGSLVGKSVRSRLGVEALEERAVPTVNLATNIANFPSGGIAKIAQLAAAADAQQVANTGFHAAITIPTHAFSPQLAAAGDFNRDGKIDLAVTDGDNSYSILRGDGTGNFTADNTNLLTGNSDNTEGIVAGDFNHDGKLDLAIASFGDGTHSGQISVLMGNGDGTFTQTQTLAAFYPPSANATNPFQPTYVTAADLSGNGNLDLAVSDYGNNAVAVFTNDGNGNFAFHDYVVSNGINKLSGPDQLVAADFNGDGIPDIAVANKGNGSVSILKGLGGSYITSQTNINLPAIGSVGLAAGDLTGDGRPDLVVANYGTDAQGSHTLNVILNTGNFSFAVQPNITVGDHLINVVIADLNGDGKNDIALTSAGNTNAVPGDGSAIQHLTFVLINQGNAVFESTPTPLMAGSNPVGLLAVDVNGDHSPDLVTVNQTSRDVSVFLNAAPPSPSAAVGGAGASQGNQGNQPGAPSQSGQGGSDGSTSSAPAQPAAPLSVAATVPPATPPNPGSGQAAREMVADELTHSAEYYTQVVTAAYLKYLGRAPEASGLAYWVSHMQQGLTDERLEAGFIGSQEYINNHGGTGEAWVRGLYQDLLGRQPRDDEVAYWVNRLNSGTAPADVAYGFAASAERETQRVAADYVKYLARSARQDELGYWVNVFLNGADNEKVIAGFVGAQESFQVHGGDITTWLTAAYQDILQRNADAGGTQYFLPQLQ